MLWPIPDHDLALVGVANEIVRLIQNERKLLNCNYSDQVIVRLCPNEDMMSAITLMKNDIELETQSTIEYDWTIEEDRTFSLDVNERLEILPPESTRRYVDYGMKLMRKPT